MRKYVPSKRPLVLIYIFLFAVIFIIQNAFDLVSRFLPFSADYIILPLWLAAAFIAMFILPVFFAGAFFTVNGKEITASRNFIFSVKKLMPMSSVKSVTTIMLPFGRFTAMNFISVNAMGARLIIPFMSRQNALEITSIINRSIREAN